MSNSKRSVFFRTPCIIGGYGHTKFGYIARGQKTFYLVLHLQNFLLGKFSKIFRIFVVILYRIFEKASILTIYISISGVIFITKRNPHFNMRKEKILLRKHILYHMF